MSQCVGLNIEPQGMNTADNTRRDNNLRNQVTRGTRLVVPVVNQVRLYHVLAMLHIDSTNIKHTVYVIMFEPIVI
jgi:hypothetical protein